MSRNQDKLKQYYLSDEPRIKGFATELGTKNYSLRSMNLSN
jgi:hypothetical protein